MKMMLPRRLCARPLLFAVVLVAAAAKGDERRPLNSVRKLFASTTASTASSKSFEDRAVIISPDRFAECPDGEFFDADGVCREGWGRMAPTTAAPAVTVNTAKAKIGLQLRCAEGEEYRDGRCQQQKSSTFRTGLQDRCPAGEAFDGQRCRRVAQSSTLRTPKQSRCAAGETFDGQRCRRVASTTASTATTIAVELQGVIRIPDRFAECPDGEFFDADGVCREGWGRMAPNTAAPAVTVNTAKAKIGLQLRCTEGEEYRDGRCQQQKSSTFRPGLQDRCPAGEAFDGQWCRRVAQSSTLRTPKQSRCSEGETFDGQRCRDVVISKTTTPRGKATTSRKSRSRRAYPRPPTTTSAIPRYKVSASSKVSMPSTSATLTKKPAMTEPKTSRTKVPIPSKKPMPQAKTPLTETTAQKQFTTNGRPRINRATNKTTCPRGQVKAKGACVEDPKRRCVEGTVMQAGKCRLAETSKETTPKGTTPFRKHRCSPGKVFVAGRCQAGPTPKPTSPCAPGTQLLEGRCLKQAPTKKTPGSVPSKKLLVNLGNTQRRCPPGEAFDIEGNCRETWSEPFE